VDDGPGNDVFLLLFKQGHLFMGLHLSLFEVRFTGALPDNALVLAARAHGLVELGRVEEGHLGDGERLVVFDFEIEHFERLKRHQIIKVRTRVSLNLLHERSHVRLILQRQLRHAIFDEARVKPELERHVLNIILLRLISVRQLHVDSPFVISRYTPFHIIAGLDLILVDELLQFHQTFSSSQL